MARAPEAGPSSPVLTPDDQKELERRRGLLGRIRAAIAEKYAKLEERYGRAGAAATAAGIALTAPVPVPGSALVPVAVAEAVLRARRLLGLTDDKDEPKKHSELHACLLYTSDAADEL